MRTQPADLCDAEVEPFITLTDRESLDYFASRYRGPYAAVMFLRLLFAFRNTGHSGEVAAVELRLRVLVGKLLKIPGRGLIKPGWGSRCALAF